MATPIDCTYVLIGSDEGVWMQGDDLEKLSEMMVIHAVNFPDEEFYVCAVLISSTTHST